jgi:hypothetical protein
MDRKLKGGSMMICHFRSLRLAMIVGALLFFDKLPDKERIASKKKTKQTAITI